MIYDITGSEVSGVYDYFGTEHDQAYSLGGEEVFGGSDPYIPGRLLLFEEKFEDSALDTSIWGYETGNVRNNAPYFSRQQNVTVKNGFLTITAKNETHLNKLWTSGGITTQGKRSWLYGRLEAKMRKSKVVVGASASFWLCGMNNYKLYRGDNDSTEGYINVDGSVQWVQCGEIDVVESPGTTKRPHAGLWAYEGGTIVAEYSDEDIDMSKWHIYAIEWTEDYIEYSVDGTVYAKCEFSDYQASQVQAYHLPQYILLTLGLGNWSGTPTAETDGSQAIFDWVRVYAPIGVDSPIVETAISIKDSLSMSIDDKYYLNVTFTPFNTSDMSRTWSTSNSNVVTCIDGVVTAIGQGTAYVEVESKHGLTARCTVTVS